MAARAATDSPRISRLADRPGACAAAASPDGPAPQAAAAGSLVARARRRLVDALMDAGRIRALGRTGAPSGPGGSVDFIGLALTVVAGRYGLSADGQAPDQAWPATPALDALSALYRALDDQGPVPSGASLRFGGPAVQRELEQLCRLAALPAAGAEAVAVTAREIAALLAGSAARAGVNGAAAPPACAPQQNRAAGFGVAALQAPIARTTVGPGGDNLSEAVVLTRLFLRRLPSGAGPARWDAAEDGNRIDRRGRRSRTVPIYPAADIGLFRAIARWRSAGAPPPLLQGRWSREATALATLAVGAADWTALRAEAGCDGLRLRVVGGTAVVLVDRSLGAVRDAVRAATWALARQGRGTLSPRACAAVMAAAFAFHGATGQTLICRRLDGSVLLFAVEVDWIDPWGIRRSDADGIDAVADVAPLAALRLLDAARAALSDHPACWTPAAALGPGGVRQLAVRLAGDLLMPAGG
ncbi:hypothetical protein [Thalassobaculum sp.]|uniref:hypothetical protein n=1 Tax=Thalassobaculum sp. TaxID=2022740 RepID=UPI003B58C097